MTKADFAPNVMPTSSLGVVEAAPEDKHPVAGNSLLAGIIGISLSACFYALVYTVPWSPLKRYFLGHPVAVAATVLFCFAVGILIAKWLGIVAESNQLEAIRDEDLLPPTGENSPAQLWLQQNDAGHVARSWRTEIANLQLEVRNSHLVQRLEELLTRQSQRGSSKHLADDLRELSARDADAAHDSLGLVRIIIWAIPMLGFLGTVIGITQTLGGLDFSNGTAAVDSLKGGLYVAFDTTALGLVLSVVAIFLQFPVERGEQRLLSAIDARVGHLVSATLPNNDASDNQTTLIADLCKGVQAAVAESLDNQARLWRDTIDEAQQHWQAVHENNHNIIAEAFEKTLVPALLNHAESLAESSQVAGDRLSQECERWKETLDQAHLLVRDANASATQNLVDGFEQSLKPALQDHAAMLSESAEVASDRLERQCQQWRASISEHTDTLNSQQQSLVKQYEAFTETHRQAESLAMIQLTLDGNLQRLAETNATINRSVSAAAAGDGIADAMRILARAVDVLSNRLAEQKRLDAQGEISSRRAA